MDPGVLLWFDVETTGLDSNALLLEVGAVVTTFDEAMTEQDGRSFAGVVRRTDAELAAVEISDLVREMHTKSGLWADVSQSPYREAEIWSAFAAWCLRNIGVGVNVYLAGRSVHFDRGWLDRMPERLRPSLGKLSHRHYDLTPIKAYAGQIGIDVPESDDKHRALPDVWADIDLARRLAQAGLGSYV
jgi:oligoribonuclease (3'-5' exoribonuclease)